MEIGGKVVHSNHNKHIKSTKTLDVVCCEDVSRDGACDMEYDDDELVEEEEQMTPMLLFR